jgi:hypothetical protein
MEAIIFLVAWIGCATLHTIFELKIKPLLDNISKDETDIPLQ